MLACQGPRVGQGWNLARVIPHSEIRTHAHTHTQVMAASSTPNWPHTLDESGRTVLAPWANKIHVRFFSSVAAVAFAKYTQVEPLHVFMEELKRNRCYIREQEANPHKELDVVLIYGNHVDEIVTEDVFLNFTPSWTPIRLTLIHRRQ